MYAAGAAVLNGIGSVNSGYGLWGGMAANVFFSVAGK